jgi:hypothetical protein
MPKNAWGDEIEGAATRAAAPRRNAWGDLIEGLPAPNKGPDPSEGMGPLDKLLVGAGHSVDRAMRGMSGIVRSGAEAMGAKFDPDDGGKAEREAEDAALYQKYHPGNWATAGEIGGDVAMSAMPVAKAGDVLRRVLVARRVPLAAAGGDIAANAAYSAATSPEDRGSAAAWGGAGASAGRLFAKAIAARAPKVAPGVKELSDRGVSLTPGQVYGGAARSIEDRATSVPVIGDLLARARKRSLSDYNRAELDDALAPLGRNTKSPGVGADAIDAATQRVEAAYDEALEKVFMTPKDAMDAARGAVAEAHASIPMLDPRQVSQLDLFVRKRIEPWVESLEGSPARGKYVKQIDAEMGHFARKFSKSPSPSDHSLGDAFYVLQSHWRDAMQATGVTSSGRDALDVLQGANEAYKNLLPIRIASERTTSGMFTPQGMRAASKGSTTELTKAARQVLPTTIPDSGSAGRTLQGALLLGGPALLDPVSTGLGLSATAALTSGPAMRGMTKAATKLSGKGLYDALPDNLKKLLDSVDPATAQRVLSNLAARLATQQQR